MDKMNAELLEILRGLIKNWENEVVEFKQANNNFKLDEIGRYFSAISNEANLKGLQYGWLVFGVENKSKTIVGSNYRNAQGIEYLTQFGSGKKKDFMELLLSKLPEVLSEKQKDYKVQNLIKALKNSGLICLDSDNCRTGSWVLSKKIK